ncbi:MAG: hypothetical protein QG657_3895 [Acidobacteriota bacterium]|nr:hypothetical protein [Acidobacteriota bacterium]
MYQSGKGGYVHSYPRNFSLLSITLSCQICYNYPGGNNEPCETFFVYPVLFSLLY